MALPSLTSAAPRPRTPAGDRVRLAALLAGAALAEVALGLMIADPRFQRVVLLIAAVAALAAVFVFPMAAFGGLLVAVASIFLPGSAKFAVGPFELGPEELLLGALLVVALVRPRRAWWGGPAGGALAVFLVTIAVSGIAASVAGRAELSAVYSSARPFAMLTVFFVVVRLFPEREQVRRLLLVAAVVAAITGVVSLLVAAPGSGFARLLASEDSMSIRDNEGMGLVNRVRLPGVALAYVLFWYAAVRAADARSLARLGWLVALAAIGASLVLSFNRNMWVGMTAGLVLLLVVGDVATRRRLVGSLAGLAAVGLVLAVAGARLERDSPLYPIAQRATTLFDPGATTKESSLEERGTENRHAVAALKEHPVLGVGPGAPFGAVGTFRVGNTQIRAPQLFLHNQYLYLLLAGGLPALLAFLVFVGRVLEGVWRHLEDRELLAIGVGMVMTLLSALVMISFAAPAPAATIGLLGGAAIVMGRSPRDSGRRPADRPGLPG